jgi:hypothetical protein
MGLTIHSLGELPLNVARGFYVYLLDYGWHEPIGDALRLNFDQMADLASRNDAVVFRGTSVHFDDEVLSWHHVNGQDAQDILPAILITTRHPRLFYDANLTKNETYRITEDKLLLIPLRKICSNATDVARLVAKIFRDIKEKKALQEFEVAQELRRGEQGALTDALILRPSISGIGFDLKAIAKFFRGR